jgi:hypothetical protein
VSLADLILILHFLFVAFVVGGFVAILIGARRWSWVRNRVFRFAHLGAIVFVAAESLLGIVCPLTALEDFLRRGAQQERSFVGRWVSWLLYYDLPEWVFGVAYCAFALAVVWMWRAIPPRTTPASESGS